VAGGARGRRPQEWVTIVAVRAHAMHTYPQAIWVTVRAPAGPTLDIGPQLKPLGQGQVPPARMRARWKLVAPGESK
jgi:hypothetical protein